MKKTTVKSKFFLAPGHTACAGCGQMIAARTVAQALGPNTIIANATGCLEVTTTKYPESSWGMPWIHSLFENTAAVASGIRAALDYKNKRRPTSLKDVGRLNGARVVAQGGDGGTFDIGLGLISGMWERGDDIIYICYDTEAYSNTGIQASGATPFGANTTTTPIGECPQNPSCVIPAKSLSSTRLGTEIQNMTDMPSSWIPGSSPRMTKTQLCKLTGSEQRKKDMIAIALAHGLNYVAQTTAGFVDDIAAKIKKALATKGPSYIQILTPCVPGWNINPAHAVKVGKLAAQTGLYPLLEYENGQLTRVGKIPKPRIKVDEYLKPQGRFAHLFKSTKGKEQIEKIQKLADENIRKYNL
ncbi:pyruvate ferredoxin oxidoreductase [Candidatus Falkowbacteria bacterium]|nr:pyruvate ferredoxin oxidoreductase [Candidatus Falkowbacteria bacterium]